MSFINAILESKKKLALMGIFIFFAACDKKCKVYGVIKEYATNNPMQGVKVILQDFDEFRPLGTHFWGKNKTYVTFSDQDGNFSFGTKRVNYKDRWILDRITAELPGYETRRPEEYTKGSNDIFLIPVTPIRFHVKNIYSKNPGVLFILENELRVNGFELDTIIFRKAFGNSYPNPIRWGRINGGLREMRDTLIYCPGKDTTDAAINF